VADKRTFVGNMSQVSMVVRPVLGKDPGPRIGVQDFEWARSFSAIYPHNTPGTPPVRASAITRIDHFHFDIERSARSAHILGRLTCQFSAASIAIDRITTDFWNA
jgi:hypothetical protein